MRVIAIIPARLNSKRFPRKLMEKINGTPLILITYQNLLSMNIFDEIIVATDSLEISDIIKNNGGEVFISKKEHFCGSDMAMAEPLIEWIVLFIQLFITIFS